ncbi:hypothetical protein ACZ75_12135 [Massilia sp. NR 4-1]|nr:hypothetical protein ACZ75_12135 [Massilia sp. NR 4-1]
MVAIEEIPVDNQQMHRLLIFSLVPGLKFDYLTQTVGGETTNSLTACVVVTLRDIIAKPAQPRLATL